VHGAKERTIMRRHRSLTPAPHRVRIALAGAIARNAHDAGVASLAGRDIVEGRFAQRLSPHVATRRASIATHSCGIKRAAPHDDVYTFARARPSELARDDAMNIFARRCDHSRVVYKMRARTGAHHNRSKRLWQASL
jgi:hypothetical protein